MLYVGYVLEIRLGVNSIIDNVVTSDLIRIRVFIVNCRTVVSLTGSHPPPSLAAHEVMHPGARLCVYIGAAMTKTLGSAALQHYAEVVSMFLPIPAENQPGLIADLEGDPFVGHALSSATCELYHRYGMLLAPLSTALTTIKHCQFGHRCPAVINDGHQADGGEPAGSSNATACRNSFASGAGTC